MPQGQAPCGDSAGAGSLGLHVLQDRGVGFVAVRLCQGIRAHSGGGNKCHHLNELDLAAGRGDAVDGVSPTRAEINFFKLGGI